MPSIKGEGVDENKKKRGRKTWQFLPFDKEKLLFNPKEEKKSTPYE